MEQISLSGSEILIYISGEELNQKRACPYSFEEKTVK